MRSQQQTPTPIQFPPTLDFGENLECEDELVAVAGALAAPTENWSDAERQLFANTNCYPNSEQLEAIRDGIARDEDPLGNWFCQVRSAKDRRNTGAVYTPQNIVKAMIDWAGSERVPLRIVDPGAGSGRFILAAARRFPKAELIAIENDPVASLVLRANATVLGVSDRLSIHVVDYRDIALPKISGPTLFIGNPPYVRHHGISPDWKSWLAETAAKYGVKASKLSGLHIHFFLKTRELARPCDFGTFITSAEWLDVNYGSALRNLLADGLGGTSLYVLSPDKMPFSDAITTGSITCFRVGDRPKTMVMQAVDSLDDLSDLSGGKPVPWAELERSPRWSLHIRSAPSPPKGFIELGELCAVHRGQVTGANKVWIAGGYPGKLPEATLLPTITRARELLAAGPALASTNGLRQVIDLPTDLDVFEPAARKQVDAFIAWAREQGADKTYVARHRRAWWSVRLYEAAPILCTYMARRAPAFVLNTSGVRHLNIAHGLYPRDPLPDNTLKALVSWLRANVGIEGGRTYAGGLTKFEPKEMERILIPPVEDLEQLALAHDDPKRAADT